MLSHTKQRDLQRKLGEYRERLLDAMEAGADLQSTWTLVVKLFTGVLGFTDLHALPADRSGPSWMKEHGVKYASMRHFHLCVRALGGPLDEHRATDAMLKSWGTDMDRVVCTDGRFFTLYGFSEHGRGPRPLIQVDLADAARPGADVGLLQFMHWDSVTHRGLDNLQRRSEALAPLSIHALLRSHPVRAHIRSVLNNKYKGLCSEEDIAKAIDQVLVIPSLD